MDRECYQRVKTHAAAISPWAFDLTDDFAMRLRGASPALARLIGGPGRKHRRDRAHGWGWFMKNLGHFGPENGTLHAMSSDMERAGVRPEELPALRTALLAATRTVSGAQWNTQLESDWGAAFDSVAEHLLRTPAMAKRLAA